jgi:hypothetical protein
MVKYSNLAQVMMKGFQFISTGRQFKFTRGISEITSWQIPIFHPQYELIFWFISTVLMIIDFNFDQTCTCHCLYKKINDIVKRPSVIARVSSYDNGGFEFVP